MRTKVLILVIVATLSCSAAIADHFGDFFVIPVAGHVPGLNGSMWQTDVVIHNFQTSPLTVEIGVVESGVGVFDNFFPVSVAGQATVTIAPGGTRIVTDVLNAHRGREATIGALLIGGDRPFAVTSRTFNVNSAGAASVGQSVPPVQEFLGSTTAFAFIPGLVSNTQFRSNIGIVAGSAGSADPLVVEVSLLGAVGNMLGSRTLTVPAGTITHVQFSSTSVTAASFNEATAKIRIVSGTGEVTGYASLVDNASNNAMFVSSGFPSEAITSSGSILANFLRQHQSE